MSNRLDKRRRTRYALGAVAMVALASACGAMGFALSGVLPGVSWGIGASLGVVLLIPAARWLRAAITGRAPQLQHGAERSGTI
jgi:hypothetical protein